MVSHANKFRPSTPADRLSPLWIGLTLPRDRDREPDRDPDRDRDRDNEPVLTESCGALRRRPPRRRVACLPSSVIASETDRPMLPWLREQLRERERLIASASSTLVYCDAPEMLIARCAADALRAHSQASDTR